MLAYAQGSVSEAEGLYARARIASEQDQVEPSITQLRALDWPQHVAADVLLGAAQTAAAQQAWDQAEELLSKVWHAESVTSCDVSPGMLTYPVPETVASENLVCI